MNENLLINHAFIGKTTIFKVQLSKNKECFIHARCFAPLLGVNEDPVTGTANGALGAYLARYGFLKSDKYKAEQGYEIGKEGIVNVEVSDNVKVGGRAYIAMKGEISVE